MAEEEHKRAEKYNINPLLTVRVLVTLHSLVPGLQLQKHDLSYRANEIRITVGTESESVVDIRIGQKKHSPSQYGLLM